jgi:hypothetical protein
MNYLSTTRHVSGTDRKARCDDDGRTEVVVLVNDTTPVYAASVLIAADTAAATAELFVPQGVTIPVTAYGLAGVEVVAVEVYTPSGYVQYKVGGVSVELSVDDNKIGFDIPGRYRLNKGITAGAAGVLRDQA